MRARTGIVLAAVFVACGVPQAFAAAKASCLQVVDPAGDATADGKLPNRDSLDILSADVATGSRNIVGVIRLASVELDPTLATGVTYTFAWRAGSVEQSFSLVQYTDGSRISTFDPNTGFNMGGDEQPAAFRVDEPTKALVFTVARKANPVLAKRGAKFSGMSVTSKPASNIGANQGGSSVSFSSDNGINGDSAESRKSYTDLTPSCVKGV